MSYATKQDMIDRFTENEIVQLTDKFANLGIINDVVLDQSFLDANAEVNSYLLRYELPLSFVPDVLIRITCDIARYYLYDDTMPEQVKVRYENAINYLIAIAKGEIDLPVDGGKNPESGVENFGETSFSSAPKVFTRINRAL